MPPQTFADLGVSHPLVETLKKREITEPFAIQKLVIADILSGRDVLAKSPTGSGKTLAFGLGLIERMSLKQKAPAALILAPTRELVRQIEVELKPLAKARSLRIATVYGGVGVREQGIRAAGSHIVVATPGRLEDHLKRKTFNLKNIRALVLDEADRMLDMGFQPAVDRIVKQCPNQNRQTLFFSATLDGAAGELAKRYTTKPTRHEHTPKPSKNDKGISHRFVPVNTDHRVKTLVQELNGKRDLALVFVRTKRGADRLVKRLSKEGITAGAIHGDKTQSNRERTLKTFESGKIDTLVATDVVARGIDIAGISHVINFDPPEDCESYVHRIGRTGRAGREGTGITFVPIKSGGSIKKIARTLKLEREYDKAFARN